MIRFLFLLLISTSLWAKEPIAIYSTYQNNPDHEITICWIENSGSGQQDIKFKDATNQQWYVRPVKPRPFPENQPYVLYKISLDELKPDTQYEFKLSEDQRSYFFHTLPESLQRPVKFVVGGDVYLDGIDTVEEMNRFAASHQPDFGVVGGDIAYDYRSTWSHHEGTQRWIEFFKAWSSTMITPDKNMIPILAVPGNHDVKGGFNGTVEQAPFYYFLFPTPEKKYRQLTIGDYASLWLLDSGHIYPVVGEQTRWLSNTLQKSLNIPYRFAFYHVPAYPSVRSFSDKHSKEVRTAWSPIFDANNLTVAFEHHEHAYKRSQLIKNGQIDPTGVLYMGDGAWGVEHPRKPHHPEHTWYLVKTAQERHILLVTLTKDKVFIEAIDSKGNVFDSTTR